MDRQKWEHKHCYGKPPFFYTKPSSWDDEVHWIDIGEDGWELVSVVKIGPDEFCGFFKRRVESTAEENLEFLKEVVARLQDIRAVVNV